MRVVFQCSSQMCLLSGPTIDNGSVLREPGWIGGFRFQVLFTFHLVTYLIVLHNC